MAGGEPQKLPWGLAHAISWGPQQGVVLGRSGVDPAQWKRYRGGRAGEIWVDETGTGEFRRLELAGNPVDPLWIRERIYFISDHEGIGNVYSCRPDGQDRRQHTQHREFYARNAATDGRRIVYHAGADIYLLDPQTDEHIRVEISCAGSQTQRQPRFVEAGQYLEDYELSPDGSTLALVCRGKSFTLGNWEGPVVQQGRRHGVRYRLVRWLRDGQHLVMVSDEGGEERLELYQAGASAPVQRFADVDIGRPYEVHVSLARNEIVLFNHRHELLWVNLDTGEARVIEHHQCDILAGLEWVPDGRCSWSPDGNWIAYAAAVNHQVRIIKVYNVETGATHAVTEPVLQDFAPVFDPAGRYLYFLSTRIFNPVWNQVHFGLDFPRGMRPYLVTLRRNEPSPFVPRPRGLADDQSLDSAAPVGKITIDFDGISERIVPLPVAEAIYEGLAATRERVFYTVRPIEGAGEAEYWIREQPPKVSLKVLDLTTLEESVFVDRVSGFKLGGAGSTLIGRVGPRLRVLRPDRDPHADLPAGETPSRKTGWIDLARVKVSVDPRAEWQQIFREAWRVYRDHFWVADMAGVDWQRVYDRYYPLITRVASRGELADLLGETRGELGTSHAYEIGGDYRPQPEYKLGFLGADLAYDPEHDAYRFTYLPRGDVWDDQSPPPLKRPGVDIRAGMLLLAIGGVRLSRDCSPHKLLVNQARQEVQLTVADDDGSSPRTVSVQALATEAPLRYRDWVERNRAYVHRITEGRVGYIHLPNTWTAGYAEFYRYFPLERACAGLIIDARFNRGGDSVYPLLTKLVGQQLGYEITRRIGYMPYPYESARGPVVALANEYAGSGGDILSHSFKLMGIGPLIGRRTWGGVVGYWSHAWMVDGTLVTAPEIAPWFPDVGWGLENYGADPDIAVDIAPQDYAQGRDPQLDRAIAQALQDIERDPPREPRFERRPDRTLPG